MSRDEGGRAFPEPGVWDGNRDTVNPVGAYYDAGGMSLRDYFAAKALQGIMGNGAYHLTGEHFDGSDAKEIASDCYALADAMIAERAKP